MIERGRQLSKVVFPAAVQGRPAGWAGALSTDRGWGSRHRFSRNGAFRSIPSEVLDRQRLMDPTLPTQTYEGSRWHRFAGVFLRFGDQGIVSIGNFAVGVLVARTLGPTGFGKFALVWTALTFSILAQWAFIIAPMQSSVVVTPKKEWPNFHAALFVHSLTLGLITGFVALGIYLASVPGGVTLLGGGIVLCAFVAIVLQDFVRRWMLVTERPGGALTSDIVRHVATISGLLYLWYRGADIVEILAVIGLAAILGCALGNLDLRWAKWRWFDIVRVAKIHGQSGRVLLPFIGVQSSITTAPIYVLSAFVNAAAAAGYRVATSLIAPIIMVTEALETFLPLRAAQAASDPVRFNALMRRWRFLIFMGSAAYALAMIVSAQWLVVTFFGSGYRPYVPLIYPLALAGLVQNLVYIRQVELRAKFALGRVLSAEIIAGLTLVSLYLVIPLGRMGEGAAIAALISQSAKFVHLLRKMPAQQFGKGNAHDEGSINA